MAESERPPTQSKTASAVEKRNNAVSTFRIWPPTENTRDGVRNLLIETLSSPFILPKRYNRDELIAAAKMIEQDAYNAAMNTAASDNGIAILQAYSKRITLRILDGVKAARSTVSNSTPAKANGAGTRKMADTDAASS